MISWWRNFSTHFVERTGHIRELDVLRRPECKGLRVLEGTFHSKRDWRTMGKGKSRFVITDTLRARLMTHYLT